MSSVLPDSWAVVKLEDVVEICDNLREPVNAKERENRVGPYPYYGATGQVGWIDGYRQDGEFVLLGEDGAPFFDPLKPKAYLVSGKAWVNNHAHVLMGLDGLCQNKYLMYALNFTDYRGYANGTTRLKLTQEAMRRLPIRLAPQKVQSNIVEKIEELFTDLDASVAALERARANLKRYRASVLKAAVEGRLTAEWRKNHPATESASQLLERILAERRKKWEDAQFAKFAAAGKAPPKNWKDKYPEPAKPDTANLPELPEGWCWASVDELSYFLRNGLSQKPAPQPPGYQILRINAVRPMSVALTEVRYLDLPEDEAKEYVLENGDLLFTRYNGSLDLLGVCGLVRNCEDSVMHPDKLIRVKAVMESPLPEFIEMASNVGHSRKFIQGRARTTAGQTGISGADVKETPIPLCPLQEQREILAEVDFQIGALEKSGLNVELSLRRAASLRQSILKRAFEGRLVPQDPNDEPASALLERIRAARAKPGAAPAKGTGRRGRKRAAAGG